MGAKQPQLPPCKKCGLLPKSGSQAEYVCCGNQPHSMDLIRIACERAADKFEKGGSTFNAAGFGTEFRHLCGRVTSLDGDYVRCILSGRSDVKTLSGGCHFRIIRRSWFSRVINAAFGGA